MCCGALWRSTGCFNQQSLYTVSQPECVTQPSRTAKRSTQTSTQKVNVVSQQSTQIAAAARSTQKSQSERLASGIVPENAD